MPSDIWNADADDVDTESPRGLREYAKSLEKQVKEATAKLEKASEQIKELTSRNATANLNDALRELKVPDRIAKWVRRDEVEPTKEAVEKWLKENGEDFGYKPEGEPAEKPTTQTAPEAQTTLPPEIQAAYEAISAFTQGRTDQASPLDEQVAALGKADDLDYAGLVDKLREMGAPLVAYGTQ